MNGGAAAARARTKNGRRRVVARARARAKLFSALFASGGGSDALHGIGGGAAAAAATENTHCARSRNSGENEAAAGRRRRLARAAHSPKRGATIRPLTIKKKNRAHARVANRPAPSWRRIIGPFTRLCST